jgi:glycine cleavage system aminomethyltransferase T
VEHGAPITLGEREVGTVGSTCISPAHGPIALALIRREASAGDKVAVGDAAVEAEVIELPFERE